MEYFEIFNEQGKLLRSAPRGEVHEKGYWHKAVNIIIQRSNDDLIIQLRSKNKDDWPTEVLVARADDRITLNGDVLQVRRTNIIGT